MEAKMKQWLGKTQCVRTWMRGVVTLVVLGLIAVGTSLYLSYVTLD